MESPGKESPKSNLQSTLRTQPEKNLFVCTECDRGFPFKNDLRKHVRRVHERVGIVTEKKFKCALCTYATTSTSTLDRHILWHTGERSFPCQQHPDCNYAGKCARELRIHIIRKHQNVRTFACQFSNCSYQGKTKSDLEKHSVKHKEKRDVACDEAECNFRTKSKLYHNIHKLRLHNTSGYKPFACSTCNYRTITSSSLKAHEATHKEQRTIKCNFNGCTYVCKYRKLLKSHILCCHTEKTFKCDFLGCASSAASQFKLNLHKKLVHQAKVHLCSQCNFKAATPTILRRHMGHHSTASLPIPCPIKGCTFQTRLREYLSKHMRYHESHLACPIEGCGYGGVSSSARRRHMKLHDPTGRPFNCPICPKHFKLSTQLSKHLDIHTREKPFRCPLCNFGSVNKSRIVSHVRSIHSTVLPQFFFDKDSICDHCNVNFGCAFGLTLHEMKLKTAAVFLRRLQLTIK